MPRCQIDVKGKVASLSSPRAVGKADGEHLEGDFSHKAAMMLKAWPPPLLTRLPSATGAGGRAPLPLGWASFRKSRQ